MEVTGFRVGFFTLGLVFVFHEVFVGTGGNVEFHGEVGGCDCVEIVFDDVELLENVFVEDDDHEDEDDKHTADGDNG